MIGLSPAAGVAPHPGMSKLETWCWHCRRCSHWWLPRESHLPKVCPRCKSPYWDRARRDGRAAVSASSDLRAGDKEGPR